MKTVVLIFMLALLINSCYMNYGNRRADIHYTCYINISPYYVKKYMKTLDSFYANRALITSEIVNFPENFIPVTDSVLGFKYVIEFVSFDSISYLESNYINLASLYDFKKRKWIKDLDDLQNNELDKFRKFFKDSVLTKVINKYKNTIPDSLLFIGKSKLAEIKPLR